MVETDALIIGGGIAGAATAFGLARRGREVALVERGEIAGEASGVNAGQIGAAGWGDVPDLEAYLTMGSLQLFMRMQLDLGFDIEFRQSGALTAVHDAAQYDCMSGRVREMRERGLSAELISARQARAIEPEIAPDMPAYMYAPLRGQADPAKATRAFAAAARREGARIFTGRAVVSASQTSDGGWRVSTSDGGETRCRTLIIAAGAWSAKIGEMVGLNIPVRPVLGQMWATGPIAPAVFQTVSSAESAYAWSLDDGRGEDAPPNLTHRDGERRTRHLYGRQRRNGEMIFGGDRRAAGFDKTVDSTGVEVNRAHAAEALPFLSGVPAARTWSGLMPFSLDGDPLIGEIPLRDNLYIVGGLSGSGFGRGPMAADLLAELIHSGNRHPVLAQADPSGRVTEAG